MNYKGFVYFFLHLSKNHILRKIHRDDIAEALTCRDARPCVPTNRKKILITPQ